SHIDRFPITLTPAVHSRLKVAERLLIFSANTSERSLHLTNTGHEPLPVFLSGQPAPYTVTPAAQELLLQPEETREVLVQHSPGCHGQTDDEMLVRSEEDEYRVKLRRLPEPDRPVRQPKYIVSLDFGTCNSSAILRDMQVEDPVLAVSSIPHGEPRKPSCMYYSRKNERWRYGEEAIASMLAEADSQSVFVDRLKDYLCGKEEPFRRQAEEAGLPDLDQFTVDQILARFFRYWRREIERTLLQRSDGAEPEVHYVFSVPVLDAGPLYQKHLERMKTGLAAAGFATEDSSQYTFVQEPVAAVLYFLIGKARNEVARERFAAMLQGSPLQKGVPLALIDSGAGTTDVAIGIAGVSGEGAPEFEVRATLGLDIEARRFGGNNISEDLFDWLQDQYNITEVFAQALGRKPQRQELINEFLEPAKIYLNSPSTNGPRALNVSNCAEILSARRAVPELMRPYLVALFAELRRKGVAFSVTEREMDQAIGRRWDALDTAISGMMAAAQTDSPIAILVGGNTHQRSIGRRCSQLFGAQRVFDLSALMRYELPSLSQDDKMLAVAGGAVWLYGARLTNLNPYRLEVSLAATRVSGAEEQIPLFCLQLLAPAGTLKRISLDLTQIREATLVAETDITGQLLSVMRSPLLQRLCGRQVEVEIEADAHKLTIRNSEDRMEIAGYRF
ncbi:MAG TPA: hypothetical protein VGS41_09905, partial [Chthonomonadales bacterium]|nr:hypothetical protein [Chthonomonadales bacterium]